MDDLLTIRQVAIILKIHPLSVRRYISNGKLNAVKIGGNVRVSQKDLKDFVQIYVPNTKQIKKDSPSQPTVIPFSPNDPLFRLKGRGLSLGSLDELPR